MGDGAAGELQGQLDLTVMVAFMLDHVLEEEVVVVKVHGPVCFDPVLNRRNRQHKSRLFSRSEGGVEPGYKVIQILERTAIES
jgi:hypothetical protein